MSRDNEQLNQIKAEADAMHQEYRVHARHKQDIVTDQSGINLNRVSKARLAGGGLLAVGVTAIYALSGGFDTDSARQTQEDFNYRATHGASEKIVDLPGTPDQTVESAAAIAQDLPPGYTVNFTENGETLTATAQSPESPDTSASIEVPSTVSESSPGVTGGTEGPVVDPKTGSTYGY